MKAIFNILLLLLAVSTGFGQQTEAYKKWSLADCIKYAVENNITIKEAQLTKQSADVNLKQAEYSRFPSLSASVSQKATNGSSIDPITSNYVSQVIHSTNAGIGTQVTLYNGNYINNTIKQNELLVKQNEFFVSEAKNNILLSVTEAYLQALYCKEAITVAENTVSSSKEQIAQMQTKFKAENLGEQLSQSQSAYQVAVNEQRYLQTVFDRQKSLYQSGVISQSDYQEAEYNLKTAKGTTAQKLSDLKKAQTNLGYANIYSPIGGVVLSKAVDEGQTVAASYSTPTLFTIAQDLKQMQVEADVDEADIGNVKQGQRVEFTVDAFPGETFSGKVSQVRLNATVTSNVVTYTVIIKADNPDEKLKPGLTATVSVYTMEVKDVLTAEAKAFNFQPDMALLKQYNTKEAPNTIGDATEKPQLKDEADQKTVWVKDNDGIHPQQVMVGVNDGINYQIVDGLTAGTQIVTSLSQISSDSAQPQQGQSAVRNN